MLLKEARMIVFHLRGADNGVDFPEHVTEIVRLLDHIDEAFQASNPGKGLPTARLRITCVTWHEGRFRSNQSYGGGFARQF